MPDPVAVTVFARLDCCVPDFTGKNALLARLLHDVRQELRDVAKIEVVPAGTRADRLTYYTRMVDCLLAGGYALPFARDSGQWTALRRELDALGIGRYPGPGVLETLRAISSTLFWLPPIIAIDGRAVFVTEVPSTAQLIDAVRRARERVAGDHADEGVQ